MEAPLTIEPLASPPSPANDEGATPCASSASGLAPPTVPLTLPAIGDTPTVEPLPRLNLNGPAGQEVSTVASLAAPEVEPPSALAAALAAPVPEVTAAPEFESAPEPQPEPQPGQQPEAAPPASLAPAFAPPVAPLAEPAATDEPGHAPAEAAAFEVPVVPDAPALMSPAPTSHHPSQLDVPASVTAEQGGRTRSNPFANLEIARGVFRTLATVILAGALGVGAHLATDWWQQRDAAVDANGADPWSWPETGLPAVRYTDTTTTFADPGAERVVEAHADLADGTVHATVVNTDSAGASTSQEVDYRVDHAHIRGAAGEAWNAVSPEDAAAMLGTPYFEQVLTVREMLPVEAEPYVTVVETAERVLPVGELVEASSSGRAATPQIATSTDPTTPVWQYRVIIDLEAFEANEPAAFTVWNRQLGQLAVARFEVSVDPQGVVRQYSADLDGTVVTHRLDGAGARSTRFDTDPVVDQTPAPAPTPAAAEADADAEVEVEQ